MKVTGWKGWISATSHKHKENLSIVDYMPPIMSSINEPANIQELIRISQKATEEVGQSFVFLTFDLPVAKKAYDIIWQKPCLYKNVIIHLGVFHTMMSYLAAQGKIMKGSCFEEIVIEAGLCANGSLEKALSGKHYNRSMRMHTHMLEALERLLFTEFVQNTQCTRLVENLKLTAKPIENDANHNEMLRVIESDDFLLLFFRI